MSELDIAALAGPMRAWIRGRRDHHRLRAEPLTPEQRSQLGGHFEASTLDRVRTCDLGHAELQRELDGLESAGMPLPPGIRGFTGLTWIDTIAVCAPRLGPHNRRISVLFQECVHVCQYALVDLDEFVAGYLGDLVANGLDVSAVTVEREAQELRDRFDAAPGRAFSVEAIVRRRVRGDDPGATPGSRQGAMTCKT